MSGEFLVKFIIKNQEKNVAVFFVIDLTLELYNLKQAKKITKYMIIHDVFFITKGLK